jgi:hypothetical protein
MNCLRPNIAMKTSRENLAVATKLPGFIQNGGQGLAWVGWMPLCALPLVTVAFGFSWEPWVFMWTFAFALFLGCKWLTWWPARRNHAPVWQNWAYLLVWPGLDVKAFLDTNDKPAKPAWTAWAAATAKIIFGVVLAWGLARMVPDSHPLLRGWIGLVGLIFVLHFGTFHLLALVWQQMGINAQPIMRAPARATSLAEFWGVRWNAAFHRLAQDLVFRPLRRRVGAIAAMMIVFLISGIIHDLIISLPARGGYGLPTLYFLIQGVAFLFERSKVSRAIGLRHGFAGWLFMALVTAGPVFWLFHPAFINRVIIPFMRAIHAL